MSHRDAGQRWPAQRVEPRRLTTGLNVSSFSLSNDDSRIAYAVMTDEREPVVAACGTSARRQVRGRLRSPSASKRSRTSSISSRWEVGLLRVRPSPAIADVYRMPLPFGVARTADVDIRLSEFSPDVSPTAVKSRSTPCGGGSRDVHAASPRRKPCHRRCANAGAGNARRAGRPMVEVVAYLSLAAAAAGPHMGDRRAEDGSGGRAVESPTASSVCGRPMAAIFHSRASFVWWLIERRRRRQRITTALVRCESAGMPSRRN